ncbi:hypothetical protein ACFQ07_33300, partial [Actinomadura adrarensis]
MSERSMSERSMSEPVSLTVPEQTTACFVVATERVTEKLPLAALHRLAEPFATEANARLGT